MARSGYLILDSDLHLMEPDDLWARHLEGPHRANLPRFFGGQQQKLGDSSGDKGHADTIMGMDTMGTSINWRNSYIYTRGNNQQRLC